MNSTLVQFVRRAAHSTSALNKNHHGSLYQNISSSVARGWGVRGAVGAQVLSPHITLQCVVAFLSSVLGGESFQKSFGMEDEPFLQLPAGQTIQTQPATDGKVAQVRPSS
ncbi:hypothetical protein NQZ68_024367 [Dissostichus eleginoides]|nr:hypothetical protein NQZ68_024367 [Dissostichus eleginoides]